MNGLVVGAVVRVIVSRESDPALAGLRTIGIVDGVREIDGVVWIIVSLKRKTNGVKEITIMAADVVAVH